MDILPFLMLPVAFVLMFLGVQVAFSMMLTAVLFGLAIFGDRVVFQFIEKIEDLSSNFVFAAVPLFVFMGAMLEKSGIADKLFEAIHIWTRRLPGGRSSKSSLDGRTQMPPGLRSSGSPTCRGRNCWSRAANWKRHCVDRSRATTACRWAVSPSTPGRSCSN